MALDKALQTNIDKSDLVNFPNARIKDNTGTGDGTPVDRDVYGDIHEFFAAIMRMAGIKYNNVPDSVGNGYQLVEALQAVAGKNSVLYTLNSNGTLISIATKLGILKAGEILICKSAFNYGTEASITGNDSPVVTKSVTVSSAFKTNDYLLFIYTGTTVTLIRLATADNLNVLVTALNFLKAATNLQEITGIATDVATTPASNLTAFEDRVTGDSSEAFLATESNNGLMSSADKALLDSLNNPVKNTGWFSGVDIGGDTVGTNKPVGGNITAAIVQTNTNTSSYGDDTTYLITMANAMANTNYFVRIHLESQGNILTDNNLRCPVFRPVNTTQFLISVSEAETGTQSIKIHLEVVQLP